MLLARFLLYSLLCNSFLLTLLSSINLYTSHKEQQGGER